MKRQIKSILSMAMLLAVLASLLCGCSTETADPSETSTPELSQQLGEDSSNILVPTAEQVISCLNSVPSVLETEIGPLEEDGSLKRGKLDVCLSQIFFSSELVDQSEFDEESVAERGTVCGGCIEVFANAEDAEVRNDYLAKFDGGLFDSGSHTVIGTLIIRTSTKLTDEEQETLEANIISVLLGGTPEEFPEHQPEPITDPIPVASTETEATTVPVTEPTEPTIDVEEELEKTVSAACSDYNAKTARILPGVLSYRIISATEVELNYAVDQLIYADTEYLVDDVLEEILNAVTSDLDDNPTLGEVFVNANAEYEFSSENMFAEPEVTEPVTEEAAKGTDYIGNKNTKKFHYAWCGSVGQMKESNKYYYNGTREEMIAKGYVPCKKCNP